MPGAGPLAVRAQARAGQCGRGAGGGAPVLGAGLRGELVPGRTKAAGGRWRSGAGAGRRRHGGRRQLW